MKKSIFYIIIVILFCVIVSKVTYVIMDIKNDDKIYLVDIYKENDKIIEEFEVVLNDKKQIVKVEFTYSFDDNFGAHIIEGKYNNVEFSLLEYYNSDGKTKDSTFNVNNIKANFNEKNFKIITGEDNKNYLMVITNSVYINTAYLYNDNMKLLTDNLISSYDENDDYYFDGFVISSFYNVPELENNISPWYEDKLGIHNEWQGEDNLSNLKIENNKIYFLAKVFKNYGEYNFCEDDNCGTLEERVYSINNNELTYEVINSYKIVQVSNQI